MQLLLGCQRARGEETSSRIDYQKMYSYLKFAKHTFLIGLLHTFGVAQSLVFLPIITKILGAEDYGIWIQIKVAMGLLIPIAFFGLSGPPLTFFSAEKKNEKM